MAKESTLWKWLRDGTNGTNGPVPLNFDMNRIENAVSSGMPDVEGIFDKQHFWIELKRIPLQKLMIIEFQPKQIPFLEKRWRLGGASWLLVAIGEGANFKRYMIRGCDARRFEDSFTVDEIEDLSVIDPKASPLDIVRAAAMKGFG